jgi:hypothetical protein
VTSWTALGGAVVTPQSDNLLGAFNGVKVASGGSETAVLRTALLGSVTSGTAYSVTAIWKAGTSDDIFFRLDETGVGSSTASVSAAGVLSVIASTKGTISLNSHLSLGNDVYQTSVTWTPNFTGGTSFGLGPYSSVSGEYITVYTGQLEAGSFPTSYIPTSGATATRSADVASIPTSAFGYNQKAGTVVCEFDTQYGPTGFPRVWEIGNTSTSANRVLSFISASASQVRCAALANGVSAADFVLKTDASPASGKLAFAFADNDFAGVIDGGSPVVDTSGSFTTPSLPRDRFTFGGAPNITTSNMNGHIKSIQYYPRRLTNAQLQELTA